MAASRLSSSAPEFKSFEDFKIYFKDKVIPGGMYYWHFNGERNEKAQCQPTRDTLEEVDRILNLKSILTPVGLSYLSDIEKFYAGLFGLYDYLYRIEQKNNPYRTHETDDVIFLMAICFCVSWIDREEKHLPVRRYLERNGFKINIPENETIFRPILQRVPLGVSALQAPSKAATTEQSSSAIIMPQPPSTVASTTQSPSDVTMPHMPQLLPQAIVSVATIQKRPAAIVQATDKESVVEQHSSAPASFREEKAHRVSHSSTLSSEKSESEYNSAPARPTFSSPASSESAAGSVSCHQAEAKREEEKALLSSLLVSGRLSERDGIAMASVIFGYDFDVSGDGTDVLEQSKENNRESDAVRLQRVGLFSGSQTPAASAEALVRPAGAFAAPAAAAPAAPVAEMTAIKEEEKKNKKKNKDKWRSKHWRKHRCKHRLSNRK